MKPRPSDDPNTTNRAARRAATRGRPAVERAVPPGTPTGRTRPAQGRRVNPIRRTG